MRSNEQPSVNAPEPEDDDVTFTLPFARWMASARDGEVYEFAHRESPRCDVCGRVVWAPDCDPEPAMCRWQEQGEDHRCNLLRAHFEEVKAHVESIG